MNDTTCPRCNRKAVGWFQERADVCAPYWWAECIREPHMIEAMRKAMTYDAYRREN